MSSITLEQITEIAQELPVAVWVARVPTGELVFANRMFEEIMGIAGRDDVAVGGYAEPYGIHKRDGRIYPESEMPFLRCLQERALVVVDDISIHRPDGRRVHVRAYARPLFGDRDDITHVSIAFIDVTAEVDSQRAREEIEATLNHLQKLESVGQLAGGVAHDFNNLLATVKVLASVMRLDERESVKQESLTQIEQVVDSAMQLTRNLLDFARRTDVGEQRVSLDDVVEHIGGLVKRTFPARVAVRTRREAAHTDVVGERTRLEEVL
ncbi:MAG: PAS domain-containing protein, partial [Myxococcales bacterium]